MTRPVEWYEDQIRELIAETSRQGREIEQLKNENQTLRTMAEGWRPLAEEAANRIVELGNLLSDAEEDNARLRVENERLQELAGPTEVSR